MNIIRQHVGVDVSAKTFHVHFQNQAADFTLTCKGRRKFDNTPAGHRAFVEWVEKRRRHGLVLQVVMEATGAYHEALAYYCHERQLPVVIVLPNRIKAFARSLNNHSKTDRIDAAIIARYAASTALEVWQPVSPHMRRFRFLTREREQLIEERTQIKNQRHATQLSAHCPPATLERQARRIDFIDKQIDQIETELAELAHGDKRLARGVEVLSSIPGIGMTTACIILAETDCFALFSNRRQLIKYAGLDIVERQSGTSVHGKSRVSKRGNSHLRAALYMPAKTVSRANGSYRNVFDRYHDRYGIYNRALLPVQRRLLLLAYALMKHDECYDAQHGKQQIEQEQVAITDHLR